MYVYKVMFLTLLFLYAYRLRCDDTGHRQLVFQAHNSRVAVLAASQAYHRHATGGETRPRGAV